MSPVGTEEEVKMGLAAALTTANLALVEAANKAKKEYGNSLHVYSTYTIQERLQSLQCCILVVQPQRLYSICCPSLTSRLQPTWETAGQFSAKNTGNSEREKLIVEDLLEGLWFPSPMIIK